MLVWLMFVLAQADPAIMTAEDYCKLMFRAQCAELAEMEKELADLPKNSSWATLSSEARAKLEKPLKDRIKAYKASKAMPVVIERDLSQVTFGTVFQFQVTRVKEQVNDDWREHSQLDKTMRFADFSPELRFDEWSGPDMIVISGLKPSEIKQSKTGRPQLHLKGLWVCVNKITIRGIKYQHIKRWPHEAEARKMWPKYYTDHKCEP